MQDEFVHTIHGIPTRLLGNTGVRVTIMGLGGYHLGKASGREAAVRIVRRAIDEGINFLDNACCYFDGDSERYMGEALQGGYRDRVFLMTKNHGRDAAGFQRRLEESLRRLRTDHIDLVQFHEIDTVAEVDQIMREGAIEAAERAREQGLIRFIGFTGHSYPEVHLYMLAQPFAWDTVQLPINLLDACYRSFAAEVVPVLQQRGIGVIGMKSMAGGRIFPAGVTAEDAIAYALSQRVDSLIVGCESEEELVQDLDIVRRWRPMDPQVQFDLQERTRPFAEAGDLEDYKPKEPFAVD